MQKQRHELRVWQAREVPSFLPSLSARTPFIHSAPMNQKRTHLIHPPPLPPHIPLHHPPLPPRPLTPPTNPLPLLHPHHLLPNRRIMTKLMPSPITPITEHNRIPRRTVPAPAILAHARLPRPAIVPFPLLQRVAVDERGREERRLEQQPAGPRLRRQRRVRFRPGGLSFVCAGFDVAVAAFPLAAASAPAAATTGSATASAAASTSAASAAGGAGSGLSFRSGRCGVVVGAAASLAHSLDFDRAAGGGAGSFVDAGASTASPACGS